MEFIRRNYKLILALIPMLSFVMHLHIFQLDLVGIHVWRQTQTQTVTNNFYKGDMNILNPLYHDIAKQSQKMEFPIMQWIFAVFHKILGDNIAISRFLTFIIGLFSVLGMFSLADTIFKNKAVAAICAWTFTWSPVFYYYTVNPLPDNFALCCGIWAAVYWFRYIKTQSIPDIVFSAAFLSLSSLAKLPFILYGILVPVYIILRLRKQELTIKEFSRIVVIYFIALLPVVLWYAIAIPTWEGNGIVKGILDNNKGMNAVIGILTAHLVSILPELILNYGSVLFFIAGFYFLFRKQMHKTKYFPVFLAWGMSIIAYFLFEVNMIGIEHDYYLFPFLPVLFLIVALGAGQLLNSPSKFLNYFATLLLIILPLTAYLRINSRWDTVNPGFNPVYYQHKDELRNLIPKDTRVIVGNDESHFITLYYLDRKGWAFDNNWLEEGHMEQYISAGAQYLFTDSDVDKNDGIKQHLDEKIFENGTLRVYKLK